MALRRTALIFGILATAAPLFAFGQPAPPSYFVVCGSQPNLPTVYFSGVLQGPTSAWVGFRNQFQQYLSQQYGYNGAVGCVPANTALNAQNFINARSTALRNAKKNVVDTGWTQAGFSPQAVLGFATPPSNAPANNGATSGTAAVAGGGGQNASPQTTAVINSIFGPSSSGGAGCSATAPSGSKSANGASGTSGSGAAGSSGCQVQSPFQQVSSVLTNVFGNKSGGGASGGGGTAVQGEAKPPAPAPSDGALGSGQSKTTKLTVYGCGRQDTEVACVTDLTNQNQRDTLVQAADVWKDAFIVDDRGDRHQRSGGFFLNIDGDQRSQIDVSYGKTVRFVLMFDSVPTKVQKVALRSGADGLDVENINLLVVASAAASSQASGQAH